MVEKFDMSKLLGVDCDRKNRRKCVIANSQPSLTEQWHKEACDINNVVKQYVMQGYRSEDFRNLAARVFADASRFVDNTQFGQNYVPKTLEESYAIIEEARQSFVRDIPAAVRVQFDNDPMAFYKYAASLKNQDELRKMFSDVRNFAVPTAEQLNDGLHADSSNQSSTKSGDGE